MSDFDGFRSDRDAEEAQASLADPVTEAGEEDVLEQAESVTADRPGDAGFGDPGIPFERPDPPEDQ
jgi:hypothetical protein